MLLIDNKMLVSLVYLSVVSISLACQDDQVSTESGCVDKCFNLFYNRTTEKCENYSNCEIGLVLNETINRCQKDCKNGYFNGTDCICDADWNLKKGVCIEFDEDYNTNDWVPYMH